MSLSFQLLMWFRHRCTPRINGSGQRRLAGEAHYDEYRD